MQGAFTVCAGREHYTTFFNDCWQSLDGTNWTELPTAPWSKRAYPEIVTIPNGTMLMLGGESGIGGIEFLSDVWRSDDGAHSWYLVNHRAPWAGRAGHKGLVVGKEVWMLGGGVRTLARRLFNDVWITSDLGLTWEQRTSKAEWSPRAGMETAIIGSEVFLMGGDHDVPVFSSKGPNFNDVWKSGDGGRSWQFVDTADWITRTGQKCAQLELNGTIYCVGGAHQNGTTFLQHDVWSSQDGHKWNQISNTAWGCAPQAASCGKDDMLLLPRDGELWTFGGDEETGQSGGQDNSVWAFSP